MTIKVGDTLHRFDMNRRVYEQINGRATGAPIYEKHFEAFTVKAIDGRSLIIAHSLGNQEFTHRLNKKTLREPGEHGCSYVTDVQKADMIYRHDHQYKIKEAVGRADLDVETLKKIADLVGYGG